MGADKGVAYATFNDTNISITGLPTSGAASGTIVPGSSSSLFDTAATATARTANSGSATGAEVAQLYTGLPSTAPSSPVRRIRGFQKVSIKGGGGSATVTFKLKKQDLSYWDTSAKAWTVQKGSITVSMGAGSRGIRLTELSSFLE
jgi:beta-glucosidase